MDDAHISRPSPQKRVETCLFFLIVYLSVEYGSKVKTDRVVLGGQIVYKLFKAQSGPTCDGR